MSEDRDTTGIRRYDSAAGGWGALRATAEAIRTDMDDPEAIETLLCANKPSGFDCPGCAWPDRTPSATFQFCEKGAKAITRKRRQKRAPPEFFAQHTVTELLGWSDHMLEDQGRLTHPMEYDAATDRYRAISWEAAFAGIGETLRQIDPRAVEFYTSGPAYATDLEKCVDGGCIRSLYFFGVLTKSAHMGKKVIFRKLVSK